MKPSIWINRQPIPKLRSTLKHLYSWSNQDIVALANREFGGLDLDNKQIGILVKLLKDELTPKPTDPRFFQDVSIGVGIEVSMRPSPVKLGGPAQYISKGTWVYRPSSLHEAILEALAVVQDSKTSWEDARNYDRSQRKITKVQPKGPANKGWARKQRDMVNLSTPLPDNAEEHKKYWGLQAGDLVQDQETQDLYKVQSVRPLLDGPPTVVLVSED